MRLLTYCVSVSTAGWCYSAMQRPASRCSTSMNSHCCSKVAEQIEWRDLVPLTELPDELARFDINIAPLEPGNPFCEAKSELKYFEAALAGACTVASPTGPMSEAIRNGETGILADTPEDWCEAISALIADAKLRRRLAHAAYLDVLWRYGPHRRAELVSSLLSQITGGQRAAQAFELEFRRQNAPQAGPLDIAPSEVVFVANSLGTAQISTVIPLFNYGGYVTEALESVRAQTVDALDLVVVDDCSTDNSLAVALAWAKEQARTERFDRIVVMRNHVNCGLARTRNAGFDAAETDFVVPLDADNRLLPEFCARTLETLRGSCAAFAYTKIQCFGDQDHLIGTDAFSQMRFAQSNYVDAMALVAKWAWVAVGGYTHIQHGWEDYDFWCCCVERGNLGRPRAGGPRRVSLPQHVDAAHDHRRATQQARGGPAFGSAPQVVVHRRSRLRYITGMCGQGQKS